MDWNTWREFFEIVMQLLRPTLEVAILAFLIYKVLYFMRGTRGAYILTGIIVLLLGLSIASDALDFVIISWLIEEFWGLLAMAIIVIFQPELRRAFAQLGSMRFQRSKRQREVIGEVVTATENMANHRVGALIVLERRIGLRTIEEEAIRLDIKVNSAILEAIFFPKSPLHDGAVIIRDNRIVAARAILPLPRGGNDISRRLGTRHRSAIGISEDTDAVVVVVSEETGRISICLRGILRQGLTPSQLETYLDALFIQEQDELDLSIGDLLAGHEKDEAAKEALSAAAPPPEFSEELEDGGFSDATEEDIGERP